MLLEESSKSCSLKESQCSFLGSASTHHLHRVLSAVVGGLTSVIVL